MEGGGRKSRHTEGLLLKEQLIERDKQIQTAGEKDHERACLCSRAGGRPGPLPGCGSACSVGWYSINSPSLLAASPSLCWSVFSLDFCGPDSVSRSLTLSFSLFFFVPLLFSRPLSRLCLHDGEHIGAFWGAEGFVALSPAEGERHPLRALPAGPFPGIGNLGTPPSPTL